MRAKATSGFTIVELLIVIVVIAILASISVTAYSGVQQHAKNMVYISDTKKMINLIRNYTIINGVGAFKSLLPELQVTCLGEGYVDLDPGASKSCFAQTNFSPASVTYDQTSSALDTALKSIGNYSVSSLPALTDTYSTFSFKITAPEVRWETETYIDGAPALAFIFYYLSGDNADCVLPQAVYVGNTGSKLNYTATSGAKNTGTHSGVTYCETAIAAP